MEKNESRNKAKGTRRQESKWGVWRGNKKGKEYKETDANKRTRKKRERE